MRATQAVTLGCALLANCGGRSSLGFGDVVESGSGSGGRANAGAPAFAGGGTSRNGGTGAIGGGAGTGAQSLGGQGAGGSAIRSLPGSPWEVLSFDPIATDRAGGYYSVWSDGPDRVWFTESTADGASLLHWEDGVFSSDIGGCGVNVATIRGNSASDLWFAGCKATLTHFTGTAWTSLAPLPAHWVWVNLPTDVWTCCQKSPDDAVAAALHWDGSTWNAVALPSSEYAGGALWSSGHEELWIADKDLLHWDGSAWETFNDRYVDNWRDVWGDGTNVWAVGNVLARWDGRGFEEVPGADLNGELEGVWARAPNDVWFVGASGTILHWDGAKLDRESVELVNPNLFFFGVWGVRDALWVVGAEATLLRRRLAPLP